jgi:putative membrane protein
VSMFSDSENAQIAELVRAVEARTSGEVAVVWTPRSDDYALHRGLWALALAALLVAEVAHQAVALSPLWLPGLTVLLALPLYVLLGWGPLVRRLVPDGLLAARVHRRAQAAFLDFGVTETAAASGVLLFLSQLEHRVEILADRGIAARVDQTVWQSVVDELIAALRARQATFGVERALGRIGDLLEKEFPRQAGDVNELGDAPQRQAP